jgi:hypothetical protein
MQASSAFFCSRIWFIRILCSTLQQNNKCKVRTAIEMIAQIKGICSLALVIYICEVPNICGYLFEHGRHEINGTSVPSVHFVFMFILTTDFQDFRDTNHERKRDYPLNLCNLCSKKRKTLRLSDFAFGKVKLKS